MSGQGEAQSKWRHLLVRAKLCCSATVWIILETKGDDLFVFFHDPAAYKPWSKSSRFRSQRVTFVEQNFCRASRRAAL